MAGAIAPSFLLDRRQAVPALIGRHQDFLIVTGSPAPPATWQL
jgi:hypothetical protein